MTNRTKYPPGPYSCHRDRDGCDDVWNIWSSNEELLTAVHFWAEPDGGEGESERAEATARLLASAPELLDALELANAHLLVKDRIYEMSETFDTVRGAIAKATGSESSRIEFDAECIPDFTSIRYDFLVLPPDIKRALKNVIDHFWTEAKKDFVLRNEPEKRHLAHDLHMLRVWLFCPTGFCRTAR